MKASVGVNERSFFVPILTEKVHAIEPLDPRIVQAQQDPGSASVKQFPNPYSAEIHACMKEAVKAAKERRCVPTASFPKPVEETRFVFVNSEVLLDEMIEDIAKSGECAIDLEHNDFRSYRGITCLIQVSTRDTDYVVDPFPLGPLLERLNRVTTDSRIKKVLHAGDLDVIWLQRDFGVYIVNMFDTSQAAQLAEVAGGHGLGNLLEVFCGVKTDKAYQMADWRKRPLPAGMLQYARLDTHYLLFIREKLEEILLTIGTGDEVSVWGKHKLVLAIEKSFGVSSKAYTDVPPDYEPAALKKLLSKLPGSKVGSVKTNAKVKACLVGILRWRDDVARRIDESKHFVLNNNACFKLANAIPTTPAQIQRLVGHPGSGMFAGMVVGPNEALQLVSYIVAEISNLE